MTIPNYRKTKIACYMGFITHIVVAKEHHHTNLAQVTVDQAIRENIHMDVVVEEDPDDPEE